MKTSMRAGLMVMSAVTPLCLLWGCSSDSGKPSDTSDSTGGSTGSSGESTGDSSAGSDGSGGSGTGGESSTMGGGGDSATTGGTGGTGGEMDDGGTGGSAGAPPVEIPDPCDDVDDPEMLPDLIEEDTEIGPGCFSINRTRMLDDTILTIEPGTTLKMAAAGYLSTGQSGSNDGTAAIIAAGEADAPIKFTSAAPFPAPGDWQCIHVSTSSAGSEFRHVAIEYGGADCVNGGRSSLFINGMAAITDSRVANSAGYGIELNNQAVGELEFADNEFADNTSPSIFMTSNLVTSLGEGHRFLTTDDSGDEVENPADRVEISPSQQGIRNGEWPNVGVPFLIADGVRVGVNQAVTIQAGTMLRMRAGSFDASTGYVATAGTEAEPVVFTAATEDPEAGYWPCIVLGADALLENTVIEYAGAGTGCVSGVDQKTGLYVTGNLTLSNVTVRDVDGSAIFLEDCANLDQAWCDGGVSYENVDTPALECGDAEDACAG